MRTSEQKRIPEIEEYRALTRPAHFETTFGGFCVVFGENKDVKCCVVLQLQKSV